MHRARRGHPRSPPAWRESRPRSSARAPVARRPGPGRPIPQEPSRVARARRSATATRVAAFLASHPRVSDVHHPSLPTHPDAAAISRHYVRHGSLLSFRVQGTDEARARHFADVLATTIVVRYALSFDGLTTKVNHHQTVSEYFTAKAQLTRNGFDRLIRLAIGLEDADDVIAALNWTLHHGDTIASQELDAWQRSRMASLGVQ